MSGALMEQAELQEDWLALRVAELVRIRSVDGIDPERAVAERCAELLAETGCELEWVEVQPGRPSLAAVLRGAEERPTLVLNGHTDTVGVGAEEHWSVDPFGGEIADGAVWGRGAGDMKAGLACQLACGRVLAQQPARRGTLVLHFAMGEESGQPGTLALINRGFVGDFAINTEPTGLDVAVAHGGACQERLRVFGRAAHAAYPECGRNPIALLPAILAALDEYNTELSGRPHPLLGPANIKPTWVHAGVEYSSVPGECEIVFDRRMLPGETREAVCAELSRLIEGVVGSGDLAWEFEPDGVGLFEPYELADGSAFAERVLAHTRAVTQQRRSYVGMRYSSDAAVLAKAGQMETVIFGPTAHNIHGPDEHVPLNELRQAAVVITSLARDLLCD